MTTQNKSEINNKAYKILNVLESEHLYNTEEVTSKIKSYAKSILEMTQ